MKNEINFTKYKYCLLSILFILLSCGQKQNCSSTINLLPQYGEIVKCKELLIADSIFIAECDSYFKDRKSASQHYCQRGWQYFYANILDTSMMRFNQAWLLDSNNAEIYWGFGNLLGTQQKHSESIRYFNKSLQINPNNSNVWECLGTSNSQLYFQTQNIEYLNQSVENFKKAIDLDSLNTRAYAQLTAAYCYFTEKDSARKYYEITKKINPNALNPEIEKILNEK